MEKIEVQDEETHRQATKKKRKIMRTMKENQRKKSLTLLMAFLI